jgi:hypothetical protein
LGVASRPAEASSLATGSSPLQKMMSNAAILVITAAKFAIKLDALTPKAF